MRGEGAPGAPGAEEGRLTSNGTSSRAPPSLLRTPRAFSPGVWRTPMLGYRLRGGRSAAAGFDSGSSE